MKHWEEFWKDIKYDSIIKNPPPILYGGTNYEPLASIGMSCFLDIERDKFKDGFNILDYGCGSGILANFISARLKEFKYFGLEPNSGEGPARIKIGSANFNDPRVSFGSIEDDFLKIIKGERLDLIVLISVFTHLEIDDIYRTLDNLIQVFTYNKDCRIVFSCFIRESRFLDRSQPYIWESQDKKSCYWHSSYITKDDLDNYAKKNNLLLEKIMEFTAMHGFIHHIYSIKTTSKN